MRTTVGVETGRLGSFLNGRAEFSTKGLVCSRWDREVYFGLRSPLAGWPVVEVDGHAVQADSVIELHAYPITPICPSSPGDIEYEVRLKRRPRSHVLEWDIVHSGNLDFFFQPEQPLKPGIQTDPRGNVPWDPTELDYGEWRGADRWPEVLNSWCLYHKAKKGNQFRCGKAFQVFRPYALDAAGRGVWGDIHIDPERNKLWITLPEVFVAKAEYPVIIDPVIGYETAGTAGNTTIEAQLVGSIFTAGFTGDLIVMSLYSNPSSTSRTFSTAVYNSSTLALVGGETSNAPAGTGAAWRDVAMNPVVSVSSGTDYILVAWGTSSSGTHLLQYDAGGTNQGKIDPNTGPFTWPDPIVPGTTNNNQYSVHGHTLEPLTVTPAADDLNGAF